MNGPDETPWPTAAWETFVLASCARLAQFPQVHLAPKFPPGRLNLALRTQLPFTENELLVALIDNDAGGFQNEIILTTSRLYWSERDLADAGSRNGLKSSVAIRVYGVDYALIPQGACVVPSGDESVQIALGSGQSLPIQSGGKDLAEALASYLRTVGDAARKGVDPSLDGLDPALIRRITLALPKVAEATKRMRTLNSDLHKFRRDLMAATPHIVVTPLLLAACILVFVVMVTSRVDCVDAFWPSAQQLRLWGANDGARVALRHEVWRLPASVFIHGGVIHLAVNMWCLFNIGPLVEKFFGNVGTAVLYLAAGVGGAIVSMAHVGAGQRGGLGGDFRADWSPAGISAHQPPLGSRNGAQSLAIERSELRGLQHPVRRGGAEHRSMGPHGRTRDRISGWPGVDPAMARDPVPLAHPEAADAGIGAGGRGTRRGICRSAVERTHPTASGPI